jgi:hypothetical protein
MVQAKVCSCHRAVLTLISADDPCSWLVFSMRYNGGMAIGSHTIPRFYLEQFAMRLRKRTK